MKTQRPPLFILGAPRSGTSLLFKALCLHPDAAYVSNWVERFPQATPLSVLNRIPTALPGLQRDAWFRGGNAYVYGAGRSLRDRLVPAPAEGETVFRQCGITTAAVREQPPEGPEIAALRRRFAAIARWGGGEVLVNKRIANNRRIPLLATAFPDARYVEVVRDGRAVALSLSKVNWWPNMTLWWLGMKPGEWEAQGGHPLELCARHWVEEVRVLEEGGRLIAPDRHLQIRYEDLIDEPATVLARIAEFGGLDPADRRWTSQLDRLQYPDRNEQWRKALPPEDVAVIEQVAAEALARYDYDVTSQP